MALPILDGNQSATTLSTVLTSGEHIPAHTVVSLGSAAISNITSAVSGSVVSVSNFPSTQTISGTVTANVPALNPDANDPLTVIKYDPTSDSRFIKSVPYFIDSATGDFLLVNNSNQPFPISGTVTANIVGQYFDGASGDTAQLVNPVYYDGEIKRVTPDLPLPVTLRPAPYGQTTITIGGTVTANNPNGSLTTRFGSVTTANVSQITSAVTNTSRKYLLAQNISAGTVTIGIGFSPTTTQGIQLTAGGGLTFDAFCPTGAVYWLGAVTGAAYTILEG